MIKKRKILSLLTALSITASAFAGMVIPASAEDSEEAESAYALDLTDETSRDVTTKAADNDTDDIPYRSVTDFGTNYDSSGYVDEKGYTATVAALDGWGYVHKGYTSALTEARQTKAYINADTNAFYLQSVGNDKMDGSIYFIPSNVDELELSEDGVQIYTFDAIINPTSGSSSNSPTIGFISAASTTAVTYVGYVTATKPDDNETTTYEMTFVNDLNNGKYYLYKDGILEASGSSSDIIGIGATGVGNKYISTGIANLKLNEADAVPDAVKVTFVGDSSTTLKEYDAVICGTTLTAPTAPTVSGKTFKEWQDAEDNAVTEFTAGTTDTVYTAVYTEGSTVSNVNVTSNNFAKVVLTDSDDASTTQYTSSQGTVTFSDITQGEYTYTISKTGYTTETGTFTLSTEDYELSKTLEVDEDHEQYVYYEADWEDGSGVWTNGSGTRSKTLTLGTIDLPTTDGVADIYTVNAKIALGATGSDGNSVATWTLKSSAGVLLGIQWSKTNGVFAFTGWTGSSDQNASADDGSMTNKIQLIDADGTITAELDMSFTVDTANQVINVICNDVSMGSLPLVNAATDITSMTSGMYRTYQAINLSVFSIEKPDPNSMQLSGDVDFAKVSGQTVTRSYSKLEAVVVQDEEFEWTVTGKDGASTDGITVSSDGVLSVADTAAAGTVTITCTSKTNAEKTATIDVTIDDFQEMTQFAADCAPAYTAAGQTGTYSLTTAVDKYGDDVLELLPAVVWASSNTEVATIDSATGELTTVGYGKTTITGTVTNGTAVSTVSIPVTVAVYSVTADVTGDTTDVDLSEMIVDDDYITGYQVTTAKDGVLVEQTTLDKSVLEDETITTAAADGVLITASYTNNTLTSVSTKDVEKDDVVDLNGESGTKVFLWNSLEDMKPLDVETTVDKADTTVTLSTSGANTVEIAPIFEAAIGDAGEMGTYGAGFDFAIPADTYNFTMTMTGSRADVYVNDQMLVNNMLQNGNENNTDVRNDIVVNDGVARITTCDYSSGASSSGSNITSMKIVKSPSIVTRVTKMYVLGDSLVAKYYNGGNATNNLYQTGWGQVLENYITDDIEVVDLANSGVTAVGLYNTAYSQVVESAQSGDYVILESGYNDKTYTTEDEMKAAVNAMIGGCAEKNVTIVLVSPNASHHDYTGSVAWTTVMESIAEDTTTPYIDLAQESYDFLYENYGADYSTGSSNVNDISKYYNVSDRLHSTYNGAQKWASIVATALYNLGYKDIINTEYSYTFTDSNAAEIVCKVDITDADSGSGDSDSDSETE
ncbi:MAG: Ig-like domain-containing protein [Firmicutes bacterium]|nr:Ig-like domain-containing protein [Bacillota bacterium]